MPTPDEILKIGSTLREQFSSVDFLGEIDIPEDQLEPLCRALWKSLPNLSGFNDQSAVLAAVVVNLAYYNRSEADSNSFRLFVLSKLQGRPCHDPDLWENQIGEATLRVLKKYFDSEDISGPYRYVRPVMEQAGVGHSVLPQFIDFFGALVRKNGLLFTFSNYETHVRHFHIGSSSLQRFLVTAAGHHYCREIARILRNRRDNLLTDADIGNLSPRFREAVHALLRERGTLNLKSQTAEVLLPQLVLDRERLRLRLIFPDARSLAGSSHQISDGSIIIGNAYVLREVDLDSGAVSGVTERGRKYLRWEAEIWQPSTQPWSLFSVNSGALLQAGGPITPGEYLIAIPERHDLPVVLEEYGYLRYNTTPPYKVFHTELQEGFSIPEIGLKVTRGVEAPPSLYFDSPPLRYTLNVYQGRLPTIKVSNWTSDNARNYMLVVEGASGRRRLKDEEISGNQITFLRQPPLAGRISVEATGKMTRGSTLSSIFFSVIDRDYYLLWDERLYAESDSPQLTLGPHEKLIVEGQDIDGVANHPGVWRVSPKVDGLELKVTYDSKLTFGLLIPVFRLGIRGDAIEDSILWRERLNGPSELILDLSPKERHQNIEIGISNNDGYQRICESKKVPSNLTLVLGADEIRDAFADSKIPAGKVAVKPRYGPPVISSISYVDTHLAMSRSCEPEEFFNGWFPFLPEVLQKKVWKKRYPTFVEPPVVGGKRSDAESEDWTEDVKPDFEEIRAAFIEFSSHSRKCEWQRARATVLLANTPDEGAIFYNAVQNYHDALDAELRDDLPKKIRFLEAVYHALILLSERQGALPQFATFVVALCCLRLGKNEECGKALRLLGPSWRNIKNLFGIEALSAGEEHEASLLELSDVCVHENDFELLTDANTLVA